MRPGLGDARPEAEGRRAGTALLAASVNKTSSEPIQRPSTAAHPDSNKHELSPTLSVAGTAANHPAPPPVRDEEANCWPRGTFVGRDAAGDRADKRHRRSWIEGRSELWRSVKPPGSGCSTYRRGDGDGGEPPCRERACSRPWRFRKPQVMNPFCKPICKPDAAGQAETREMQKAGDDFTPHVDRGQRGDQRRRERAETVVVWLITQRRPATPRPTGTWPERGATAGRKPASGALRGPRSRAAHALAAPIARGMARIALSALGLSGDPVHEPVHVRRPVRPLAARAIWSVGNRQLAEPRTRADGEAPHG